LLIDTRKSIYLTEIDSTNEYLKSDKIPTQTFVIAEKQTKGKGRSGKTWDTIGEEQFIFSAKFSFIDFDFPLSLIPLFSASAVLISLNTIFPQRNFQLKWPNDIFLNLKKLSGILVESSQIQNTLEVILGIGINFSGKENLHDLYSYTFLSDSKISESLKKEFLSCLISEINKIEFKLRDPNLQRKELNRLFQESLMSKFKVRFSHAGENLIGTPIRFNEYGFLVLEAQGEEIILMDSSPDFGLIL
jgi:BirA family transcriptional regulator, biotin operon repressor / biotin---[acetyl-CoA-carboxylase] ligase